MLIVDLGPGFYGLRGRIDGKIVCMATPKVEHDADTRRAVRDLIKRQGGDCDHCGGCLISRRE